MSAERSAAAQRQYAADNRAIATRLEASDLATVRELGEVYADTARRHDQCAARIEASHDRP